MHKRKARGYVVASLACLSLVFVLVTASIPSETYSLTEQELDDLLSPIALYPDPLLAQMLPASTYPAEIEDAADWLRSGGDPSRIDEQDWDENVRAIAHYPTVLYMMADNMDWTAGVGDAFLNQPADVTNTIQRLRWQARSLGNLVSTDQQTVITEEDYIQIVPAQPQYIYAPQYDSSVIYVQSWTPGISPFITFGLGLMIGSWLDLDFDWGHHHLFYHGWNRPGWVNHARPYVHVPNVFVQRSRPHIYQTWRHDPSRGDPGRYWASRVAGGPSGSRYPHTREVRGRESTPTGPPRGIFVPGTDTRQLSDRGRESLRTVNPRPASVAPSVSPRPLPQAPPVSPRPTPRTPTVSPQPTPQAPSVFGGYRGPSEVKTQTMRGQTSRQSDVGGASPRAPASRGGVPAGSGAPGKARQR